MKQSELDAFKKALSELENDISKDKGASEEAIKKYINTFLEDTFYNKNDYDVNAFGKKDSCIKRRSNDVIEVIIEVKRIDNTAEMYNTSNKNCKALHELLRYFDEEYYDNKNNNIKYLIITNGIMWYFFDAQNILPLLEAIKKHRNYKSYKDNTAVNTKAEVYYTMAQEVINEYTKQYESASFDINNIDIEAFYNQLYPSKLLKDKSYEADKESLDDEFYNGLLECMGLEERDSKVVRKNIKNAGSLLELIYSKLDRSDNTEDKLFEKAFSLCTLWTNRLLFIKLLEGRLLEYYESDDSKKILHTSIVRDFSSINTLFFQILGTEIKDRSDNYKATYGHIPYLNSLLFEKQKSEDEDMSISELDNNIIFEDGKCFIECFFDFLNSYNFSYDKKQGVQDTETPLITASVLGLVFERLNGYRDGSFYTPSFITHFMCDEVLDKVIIQKYQKECGEHIQSIKDIGNAIRNGSIERSKAREVYDTIRVLDPSVGSGHFSVATLNKLLMVKYELGLLEYNGKSFDRNEYTLESYKDDIYLYSRNNTKEPSLYTKSKTPNRQEAQEILFHEKQCIIENNIFGVDINPNSVHICQLRLWIELLKHAYFRSDGIMETLPNIDINIKQGDSLFSRHTLQSKLSNIFIDGGVNVDINEFRQLIKDYRSEKSKSKRKEVEKNIKTIEDAINKQSLYYEEQKCKGILGITSLFDNEIKEEKKAKKEAQEKLDKLNNEDLWKRAIRAYAYSNIV